MIITVILNLEAVRVLISRRGLLYAAMSVYEPASQLKTLLPVEILINSPLGIRDDISGVIGRRVLIDIARSTCWLLHPKQDVDCTWPVIFTITFERFGKVIACVRPGNGL